MTIGRSGVGGKGVFCACLVSGWFSVAQAQVVINEIHYDPVNNAVPEEFIELHNPGSEAVDVGSWALGDGIEFVLPPGTSIEAGGFLVVAQNPATMAARFGVAALGPWAGRLAGDGERIVLRDASNAKIDEVDYGVGFPWPVAASGDGASMELIHPSADNDLGSSWRASLPWEPSVPATTYLPPADDGWHYRKGLTNDPPADSRGRAWTWPLYNESNDNVPWTTGARTPIGYGDGDDTTVLDDMRYNYSTVYLRTTFTLPDTTPGHDVPNEIELNLYVDDGCIAYINGNEVTRQFVSTGPKAYNATTGVDHHEASWVSVTVSASAAGLQEGENTLAIHLINHTLESSDLSFDAEVRNPGSGPEPEREPTPGATNSVWSAEVPPNIRQVKHEPQQPTSGVPAVVTAKVTDPDGVGSVQLHYQVLPPGGYIPAFQRRSAADILADPYSRSPANPDFEDPANWTTVAMLDDGTGGDLTAGDDVFTVTLPGQPHRTLVRYRITVEDVPGASARAPFEDDPSLNFAYFCYDGVPDYTAFAASVHPEGAGHVWPKDMLTSLPVYHWVTRTSDTQWLQAYSGTDQFPNTDDPYVLKARRYYNVEGAFVYDGVVYDHVRARLRGGNSRYQYGGKRHYKFKFNGGHYFQARDQYGKKYPVKWRVFNTNRMFGNKGPHAWGVPEEVSAILWRALDVPAQYAHWFHFRVVDSTDETGQYTGDFWGLSQAQERFDVRFLEAHGLEKGNLYKLSDWIFDAATEMRYQYADGVTDGSDYENIRWNCHGARDASWLEQYVDYDRWYHYSAVLEAIRHYDMFPEPTGRHRMKNLGWYFQPAEGYPLGKCWFLPYDWDASWGPNWNNGWDQANNGLYGYVAIGGQSPVSKPNLSRDHRNVLRAFRDLVWQPDQIEGLIDDRAAVIAEFSDADRDRWRNAPASEGYQDPWPLASKVQDMKNFAFYGWTAGDEYIGPTIGAGGRAVYLDQIADNADNGLLPAKPGIAYIGSPGYPLNDLRFRTSIFSDPQGSGTFAAMEWRLAEVTDPAAPAYDPGEPFKLEWDAAWISGELATYNDEMQVPGIYIEAGRSYRVRVRFKDTSGRWGHWSAPHKFHATDADVTAPFRQYLAFTEIMYNPEPLGVYTGSDLEFIELKNTGPDPLDLSGLVFLDGLDFTFPAGSVLGAGEFFLIAANPAAFAARYPGVTVDGVFDGKLNNNGESVVLGAPSGAEILRVAYQDRAPWPVTADGMGWSLVLDEAGDGAYRASTNLDGSPGEEDPASLIPTVLINEVLTHTDLPQLDTVELYNPNPDPVDLGGWFLTDDPDLLHYRFPDGTILPAGDYLLVDESEFNVASNGFAISSTGDQVWLLSGVPGTNLLTGYAHGARFGAAFNGVSFGRHVNSENRQRFVAQEDLTLGTLNGRPKVGPLVITEIMYYPDPAVTNSTFTGEFVEIQNVSQAAVPLWDTVHPLNGWRLRDAVDFDFTAGTTLGPGERLLVVGFDPVTATETLAAFRATYGIDAGVAVYGPWSGRLDNQGETVELKQPDNPNLDGTVPYPMIEQIAYGVSGFWPGDAAGTGKSLQRLSLAAYGDEPANWFSAPASAGTLDVKTSDDVDGDGLTDAWEWAHGTDVFVADHLEDPDGDGMANLEEALAGTDPQDPASLLALGIRRVGASGIEISFDGMADRSYSLFASDAVTHTGSWNRVQDVPSQPSDHTVSIVDPAADTRFYHVVTPAQP